MRNVGGHNWRAAIIDVLLFSLPLRSSTSSSDVGKLRSTRADFI